MKLDTDDRQALQDAIEEIAHKLESKIADDTQLCASLANGNVLGAGLRDVITCFFECQSDEDAPHDWIRECLARRRECAMLITKMHDYMAKANTFEHELNILRRATGRDMGLSSDEAKYLDPSLSGGYGQPERLLDPSLNSVPEPPPARSSGNGYVFLTRRVSTSPNGYTPYWKTVQDLGELSPADVQDILDNEAELFQLGDELIPNNITAWRVKE